MTGPEPEPEPLPGPLSPPAARRRWRSLIGFIIGVLLLAAAVWAVVAQGGDAQRAWASVRHAPVWLIGAAVVLPLVNWVIISYSFWLLMRRHGRISPAEMAGLIGVAWLFNYLPLRPGLVGRIAYHRAVNRIAVADSVRVTLINMACGVAAVVSLLAVAVVRRGAEGVWAVGFAAPAVMGGVAYVIARWRRPAMAWLPALYVVRCVDLYVWMARYAVVFALVGAPIRPGGAAAVTAVSQVALCIPIVGNGMGLREWAVGLTAGALPPGVVGPEGAAASIGLAADLVNRAAELVVSIPVGLLSSLALARAAGRRA